MGYVYEDVGNRTSRTGTLGSLSATNNTFDLNDWLDNDSITNNANPYFDANGNQRTNGSNVYLYDYANRLTNANSSAVVIVYGADGNRVRKTTSTTTTLYLVATVNPTGYPQVVEELAVSGGTTNLSWVYTYGLDLISQRQISETVVTFYGYDGLGSVRFLTEGTGAITNTYAYDAYGTVIASNTPVANVYLYAGEQWDPDLGLYYLRARLMNPSNGRFLSMDSFEGSNEDPLSLHKYLYAHGNPVNGTDPSGHEFNLTSLNASIATGLRITTQVGFRAGRALTKARRFFWDSRTFNAVSKAYWKKPYGPANGRSLHHWLITQRMTRLYQIPRGLQNAGFNLLELPKVLPGNLGLNQWIGFAVNWGGYRAVLAYTIENGIRILIPLSIYKAATLGNNNNQNSGEPVVEQIELKPSDWDDDRGFEDLRELTEDDEDPLLGPGQLNQPQP